MCGKRARLAQTVKCLAKMDTKSELQSLFEEGFTEGELTVDPLWYVLWKPEKLDEFNSDYEVSAFAPEFTAFGTNGAGELLAVDSAGKVYMIPAIGMSSDYARLIAESIAEFKTYMKKGT